MFLAGGDSEDPTSASGAAGAAGGQTTRAVMLGAQATSRSGTAISKGTKSFSGTNRNSQYPNCGDALRRTASQRTAAIAKMIAASSIDIPIHLAQLEANELQWSMILFGMRSSS
jgi:hypothetical protein